MPLRSISRIIAISAGAAIIIIGGERTVRAQEAVTIQPVHVTGEEVPSSYGATPGFSRSRFSNLTQSYVLPPGAVFAGLIYQGDALRFNRPDHMLTQEIEIGLPGRFGIAFENSVENHRGTTQERTFSIEGRYALADWNKIPLNPTIFVEYKFGVGDILHDEGPPEMVPKGEGRAFLEEHMPLPDAVEVRLLLAQDFGNNVEWALNGFFEQEVGGDRGREIGFAQSLMFPIILPNERLKVGAEMQFTSFTDAGIREAGEDPSYRCVIGPTVAWKPSRNTRLDVSTLFGVTDDSPRASVFVVFSMLFGGSEPSQAEAPASTRNR
ncbi:MAG: hypothetical protein DME97_01500 [Verrucomicrobia bacterium]|nr:MAG: hypothetical protein DME97_01500 [Verrucomicrobiota bacterium]